MGAAASSLEWLFRTTAARSRDALAGETVSKDAPQRLLVGRGGDVPVFPPLAALLLTAAASAAWALTGVDVLQLTPATRVSFERA